MQTVIPVTIVTGFLGAGKTTILSNLLSACTDIRIAVLINEFGQTSIDGATIRRMIQEKSNQRAILLHEINESLIAYADDEQFLPVMKAITHEKGSVDHVLIETSGLALPTAVMQSLHKEELKTQFQLDAVVVVVDAEELLAGGFDANINSASDEVQAPAISVFKAQLESSDVVILNKIDNLTSDSLLFCEDKIRKLAPGVRFIELSFDARIDARIALGLNLHQATAAKAYGVRVQGHSQNGFSLNGHSHSGLDPHEHGLETHEHLHEEDPGWISFVLRTEIATDKTILEEALKEVCVRHPVLRLKGFVQTRDSSLAVQGVRSKLNWQQSRAEALVHSHSHAHSVEDAHSHSHSHSHRTSSSQDLLLEQYARMPLSEIVFIGYNLNRESLCHDLNRLSKGCWS